VTLANASGLPHNHSVETNRRPPSPFEAAGQLDSTSCALPSLSAAVAHLTSTARRRPIAKTIEQEVTERAEGGPSLLPLLPPVSFRIPVAFLRLLSRAFESRNGPRHLFELSGQTQFLDESVALERARYSLSLDGLTNEVWEPASDGRTVAPPAFLTNLRCHLTGHRHVSPEMRAARNPRPKQMDPISTTPCPRARVAQAAGARPGSDGPMSQFPLMGAGFIDPKISPADSQVCRGRPTGEISGSGWSNGH